MSRDTGSYKVARGKPYPADLIRSPYFYQQNKVASTYSRENLGPAKSLAKIFSCTTSKYLSNFNSNGGRPAVRFGSN